MSIEEIKNYMKKNKISYEKLAEMAGLSVSTVTKIFGGFAKYPRVDTIQAIERALGLDGEGAKGFAPLLSENEETLLRYFRTLTPELQGAALETVRVLAGVPAGNGLQKKA